MTDLRLYTKISNLPEQLKSEVVDFIDFISAKEKKGQLRKGKGRVYGYAKDSIVLKPDFDDPIEDFKEYME